METVLRVTGLSESYGVRPGVTPRGRVSDGNSSADEFVTQAREHLTVLEQVLLSLEKPDEPAPTSASGSTAA